MRLALLDVPLAKYGCKIFQKDSNGSEIVILEFHCCACIYEKIFPNVSRLGLHPIPIHIA